MDQSPTRARDVAIYVSAAAVSPSGASCVHHMLILIDCFSHSLIDQSAAPINHGAVAIHHSEPHKS